MGSNNERIEFDRDEATNDVREMRNDLYDMQYCYENTEGYNMQSIRVNQRIRALLDIYQQMIATDREFDEEYLKKYL